MSSQLSRSLSASRPFGSSSMVFTERLVVLALVFTFLIANGQIGSFPLQQSFLKHLVGIFLIGACSLGYVGHKIFGYVDDRSQASTAPYWAWLCLLSAFVMSGSLYARYQLNTKETFFINGFYIFIGFLFSLSLRRDNFERLIKVMFWLTLVFSLYVCAQTLFVRATDIHVKDTFIHEREFFVIPLLYIVLFGTMLRGWFRVVTILVIIATTAAALKSTPTLVFALTLSMIVWRWLADTKHGRFSLPNAGVVVFFLLVLLSGIAAGLLIFGGHLDALTPKGNIDFRQHQYLIAWNEFLSSPVVGSAFTAETGIYFSLGPDSLFGGVALPTHNDVLDILRGGGLVAFLLWLIPLVLLTKRAVGVLREAASKHHWGHQHDIVAWLLLTNLSAVIVYSVNPILSKTAFASLVWIYFGFLAAGVTRIRGDVANER